VSKTYGAAQVLNGVSFVVESGSIAAIIGKNGCGKSTLLSIVATMLRPDSGRVLLNGTDPFADAKLRRRIGYVAQGDSLFEELSVGDNLRFWASASDINGAQVLKSPFVELLGLNAFWEKRVSRLSGGMRRRTAICAALLSDPMYILLDEPFSGLDMVYRQELGGFLRQMRTMGKTLLYTTHSPDELSALSDVAFLLSQGRIAHKIDTRELSQDKTDWQTLFLSFLKEK